MKKKAGKNQKVTKGMPSAVLLSIAIHAALFFLAGMLVVFTVVKKKEQKFEPPKAVERPKMKLNKSSRPKGSAHPGQGQPRQYAGDPIAGTLRHGGRRAWRGNRWRLRHDAQTYFLLGKRGE